MKTTLDNRAYDVLKWFSMVVLPAAGALYFALAEIWKFPYGEEVIGTIAAVDTFLGIILGVSSAGYRAAQSAEQPENGARHAKDDEGCDKNP